MGCGSCGTKTADGKPTGCQSNGGCSSGGCNRFNTFNWLADLPLADFGKPYPIVEISFNAGSRKDFYRNNTQHLFEKGSWVAVEGAGGFDIGQISLTGELVKLQMKKYGVNDTSEIKRIIRPAAERDMELYRSAKDREREALVRSRAIAKQLNLEMKIAEVEFQADGKKVCFFYTADARVDFRELIKVYASEFKAKVEMRQIGARQESGKVGGIGSCGRELCCSTWLTDFKTVNTTAARYQNLSINQSKLSGQCGRLKCCLNYELDTYMDALHGFPDGADHIEVAIGRAFLQKKDIFRNLMWYSFSGSSKQYPLTIERVEEILALNAEGIKPEDLEAVEIQVRHKDPDKSPDVGFINDVGQLTLSSLSKSSKRKKAKQQNAAGRPKTGQPQQASGQSQAANTNNKSRENRPAKQQQNRNNSAQGQQRPSNGNDPNRQPKQTNQANPQTAGAPKQQQPPKEAGKPIDKSPDTAPSQQKANRPKHRPKPRGNNQQGKKE